MVSPTILRAHAEDQFALELHELAEQDFHLGLCQRTCWAARSTTAL
jgi:hypothetical protein